MGCGPPAALPAPRHATLPSPAPSSRTCADVHCFVLANVLRRPIILYSDEQAQLAGLSGVYLPSLWPNPREQCSRQPLGVLFGWSHFSLLLTIEGEGPASPPLLPLATRAGPLQPRFLSAAEQQQLDECNGKAGGGSSDAELALLRRYMDAERLFNGSLGVRLSGGHTTARPAAHVGGLHALAAVGLLQQAASRSACSLRQTLCCAPLPPPPSLPPFLLPLPAPLRGASPTRPCQPAGQRLLAAGAPGAAAAVARQPAVAAKPAAAGGKELTRAGAEE